MASAVAGPDRAVRPALVRFLGVRIAGQVAAVLLADPGRRAQVFRIGAAVEAVHGTTMVAAAVRWPAYRRSALVAAGLAAAFLAADVAAASSAAPGRSEPDASPAGTVLATSGASS